MSIPITEHWFSVSIRRNRKSFIFASMMVVAIFTAVVAAVVYFDARSRAEMLVAYAFAIPAIICTYTLTSQRLRDINVSGWLALLWIPVGIADRYVGGAATLAFLIVLAAVPGTEGPNRYGPDPLTDAHQYEV